MARILIADDDTDQLTVNSELLESGGHTVAIAWAASQVLGQAERVDLILMDLRMPEAEDGMALIRSLRESGFLKPVIVVSGWPEEIYGQPEEGMVSLVLLKPVPAAKLLAAVANLAG